jgi:hypothetical protein
VALIVLNLERDIASMARIRRINWGDWVDFELIKSLVKHLISSIISAIAIYLGLILFSYIFGDEPPIVFRTIKIISALTVIVYYVISVYKELSCHLPKRDKKN